MAKNILLIVEGESDEVRFIKNLFSTCYKNTTYEIYPYKTNIHVLSQELYNNYPDFEDDNVDIKLVLQSLEQNPNRKKILQKTYTDIYMIFDFEPQHDCLHFDTVRRMLTYFSDSTNQGKLYINYPMMQSYKHFSQLPDPSFCDKVISLTDCLHYKQIVGEQSIFTDITKYNYSVFYSMAVHHIKKAFYILHNTYSLPTAKEYLLLDFLKIYDLQLSLLESFSQVYVLNTCIFILSDFAPKKFFSFVSQHYLELMI